MSQNAYSQSYAGVLVQLAEIASRPGLTNNTLLPPGWSLLKLIVSDKSKPPTPNAQGFFASGSLDDSGQSVCVLALGVTWASFLDNFYSTFGTMLWDNPPNGLVPSDAGMAMLATGSGGGGFNPMYTQIRKSIWGNLSAVGSMPLYVVGKCVAGPLAQMAALDLRAGHAGPSGETALTATPTCYVFSTPPYASAPFVNYFNKQVPQSYNVLAGVDKPPVDLFPSKPVPPTNLNIGDFMSGGTLEAIDTARPNPDDNWVERSGDFYLAGLGGTPMPPPPVTGRIVNPPDKFSRDLANTLAQLSAYALAHRQRPLATIDLKIAPYQFQGDISVNDIKYCSLFTSQGSPGSVVAAFTDVVTWEELANVQAYSFAQSATFLSSSYTGIHLGLLKIYTSQIFTTPTSTNAKTFREALIGQLQTLTTGGKTLYLTGHGFGGALAGLAALDLRVNYSSIVLSKLYTFGMSPWTTYEAAQKFNTALGADAYLVARPADFAPKLKLTSQYFPINQPVRLDGVPPNDEPSGHSLTGYMNLLNPSVQQSLSMNLALLDEEGDGEGTVQTGECR